MNVVVNLSFPFFDLATLEGDETFFIFGGLYIWFEGKCYDAFRVLVWHTQGAFVVWLLLG